MEIAVNTTLVILPILYTLLMMAYARIFTRGPGGLALFVRPLLVGTVGLHFVSILLRGIMLGSCPLGSRAEFLTLVAFSICVIYLILELRTGETTTGLFAITPAFLLYVIAAVSILGTESPPEEKMGVFRSLHSLAAIVGFSAVALCSVYGLLYMFLYVGIKRGRFGLFYRKMPPLETLSDINFDATWVAFLALSVNICLGVWAYSERGSTAVSLLHAEVFLTSLLWLLYGGCIVAKHFLGLGGKRLAYTTALGALLLLGILLEGLFEHGFHG